MEKSSSKVSPDLNVLYKAQLRGARKAGSQGTAAVPEMGPGIPRNIQTWDGKVLLDVSLKENNAEARAELEKTGFKIIGSYGRMVSGTLPIEAISRLEAITSIKFARPAYKPQHVLKSPANLMKQALLDSGGTITPVISQGDTAQLSYLARKNYKVNGNGVKVGLLSDSYNNQGTAAIGVAHGELPGADNPFGFKTPVKVLLDLARGGSDEGRGMAELVHDVAPGAALEFHSADFGQANFAQGIIDLANDGCKVIADDVIYYAEPMFQDGIIAQAVDEVKKKGVTYFSSAGNEGAQSYESKYRGSNYAPLGRKFGTAHNFSASDDDPIYFQPVYIPYGQYLIFDLQWDDPSYSASGVGPKSDLDMYLLDADGRNLNFSNYDNIANGEPVELFDYYNNTDNNLFYIVITKFAGPSPSHVKYVYFPDTYFRFFLPTSPVIPGVRASAAFGHSKAEGAIATGAAWYRETPAYGFDTALVESYSSVGGVPNYFDIDGNRKYSLRNKPEITAPDGGNTSFFGFDIRADRDTFPNFFGTSAAAPHAAGVAALMIEAQKLNTITPDQIKGILCSTALDMNNIHTPGFDVGFDFNTGAGLIQANKAVGQVNYPNKYIQDLKVEAICSDIPERGRRWKITNPNSFDVLTHWVLSVPVTDTAVQEGDIIAPPGEKVFSTKTIYDKNSPVSDIVVIAWQDNLDSTNIDVAFGTSAKCGVDTVAGRNSDQRLSGIVGGQTIGKPIIADVYPNPSNKNFRLYLSLNGPEKVDITLYSIDGKILYQKSGLINSRAIDIDASSYKPGLYLLKIKQGDFTKTMKVVKQ